MDNTTPPPAKPRKPRTSNVKSRTKRGFSRNQAGGPAAHREVTKRAGEMEERTAKKRQAFDLLVAGATFAQIGTHMGVSGKTAWVWCTDVAAGIEQKLYRDAAAMIVRQAHRLDALHRTHWGKRNTEKSAKVLLEIYKREAKLLGLDAAPKREPGAGLPLGNVGTLNIYLPDNGRKDNVKPGKVIDVSPLQLPANGTEADVNPTNDVVAQEPDGEEDA